MNINFSTDEENKLKRLSKLSGMNIEDYIKTKLFGHKKNETDSIVERTLDLINKLPEGTSFNIRQIHGTNWNTITRGHKLALGKHMLAKSKEDDSMYKATYKDTSNTQWYERS